MQFCSLSLHKKVVLSMLQAHNIYEFISETTSYGEIMGVVLVVLVLNEEMERKQITRLV